jgi:hypothetical protein
VRARLRELLAYREVLVNLIRKELKVKYTASVLGAVWSLLNPAMFLAVFSLVVLVIDKLIPGLPVLLRCGVLAGSCACATALFYRREARGSAGVVPTSRLPIASSLLVCSPHVAGSFLVCVADVDVVTVVLSEARNGSASTVPPGLAEFQDTVASPALMEVIEGTRTFDEVNAELHEKSLEILNR